MVALGSVWTRCRGRLLRGVTHPVYSNKVNAMHALLLSPHADALGQIVTDSGDTHAATMDPDIPSEGFDWLISYGYRHIIREPILSAYRDRIVNLHVSYLPWNRGAHPNVWAWVDGTPHGVTIHYIDAGVDTGDIIAQREVEMDDDETLLSSYERLHSAMLDLFAETWPLLRGGNAPRNAQQPGGSHHYVRDLDEITLPDGWATLAATIKRP